MFAIEKIEEVCVYTDLSTDTFNNVVVIEDTDELILIDTFMKKDTMLNLLDSIEKQYHKPIGKIIYTHWHIDHSLGSCLLNCLEIYSTIECKNQLEDFVDQHEKRLKERNIIEPDMQIVIPNKTFSNETRIELKSGEHLILNSLPGHSYDSLIVRYKEVGIVGDTLVGEEVDVFLPPVIPPDEGKSKEEHLVEAIDYIEKLEANIIICGHGKLQTKTKLLKDNRKRIAELMRS